MELKKYKHEAPYSYTLGMAPTLELIQGRLPSIKFTSIRIIRQRMMLTIFSKSVSAPICLMK